MSWKPTLSGRAAVTIVACAAFGAVAIPGATFAAEKFQDVVVANTTANPVPTQAVGTTTVDGTVKVTNEAPIPVAPVTAPESAIVGDPVTYANNVGAHDPECNGGVLVGDEEVTTVPAGQRLIVDHVTTRMQVIDPGYQLIWLRVREGTFGGDRHFIPLQPAAFGQNDFGYAVGSDDPQFVVEEGEVLSVGVEQTFGENTCSVFSQVTTVGRLVPAG